EGLSYQRSAKEPSASASAMDRSRSTNSGSPRSRSSCTSSQSPPPAMSLSACALDGYWVREGHVSLYLGALGSASSGCGAFVVPCPRPDCELFLAFVLAFDVVFALVLDLPAAGFAVSPSPALSFSASELMQ